MFINSEPPQFRKARALAVSIAAHEAHFLSHESFVDTTKLQTSIPAHLIDAALADPDRNHGLLAPFLQSRIVEGVSYHEVMEPEYRAKVMEG
jgi:hypothetical protein